MVKKTDYNRKITESKNKIPNATRLVTVAAVNTIAKEIENKIPNITNLANKAALNTKASVIENKITDSTGFITTPEVSRLTQLKFDARMKEVTESFASKWIYTEEGNRNKHLTLVHTDESKDKLKKYEEIWNKIKDFSIIRWSW